MGRYIARRLLQTIPVFLGASFLIFAHGLRAPRRPHPGPRPATGRSPQPSSRSCGTSYHLNDPLLVQYGKYIGGLLHGDFGTDFRGRDGHRHHQAALPGHDQAGAGRRSRSRSSSASPPACWPGIRRGGFFDNLVLVSTHARSSSDPDPRARLHRPVHLRREARAGSPSPASTRAGTATCCPASCWRPLSLAYVARLTRTSLVENMRADYVRTARAKGCPRRRVIGRHVLRNCLIPVVTFIGADLGALMGGAIVTEGIFNIPGIGRAVFDGHPGQEGASSSASSTLLVFFFIFFNLIVDVLYAVLDPRIRYD